MEVIDLIEKFLIQNHVNDFVLSIENFEGALASIDYETKILTINQDAIIQQSINLNLSLEDTVCLIISHELGHYFDPELQSLDEKKLNVYKKIENNMSGFESLINEGTSYVMQAEKNAWSLGEKFIPQRLKNIYELERRKTLEQHEIVTKNDFYKFIQNVVKLEKIKRGL